MSSISRQAPPRMSPPSTSPPVEDVLRKIGRNIVNFQKLEQALRKLLPLANISISLGESRNSSGRSTKSLRKKPLGEIVERFDSAFYGDRATPESDLASAGARLSFSMKLDGGAGSEAHRREVMALCGSGIVLSITICSTSTSRRRVAARSLPSG